MSVVFVSVFVVGGVAVAVAVVDVVVDAVVLAGDAVGGDDVAFPSLGTPPLNFLYLTS
jgi:hypothetical protein